MENNHENRMSVPRKRGRPSNAEILARAEPTNAEPAADIVATPKLPPMQPIKCPCCGRGMTPKILTTTADRRYINCTLCGRRMAMVYNGNCPPVITRL